MHVASALPIVLTMPNKVNISPSMKIKPTGDCSMMVILQPMVQNHITPKLACISSDNDMVRIVCQMRRR
jgi:hypothetical protein